MTLLELREYIKSVSLAHISVKSFKTGSQYNADDSPSDTFPMVFYELPYLITYSITPSSRVDNVQFAFNIFVESNWDNIEDDHDAISRAKEIGDAIVTYIQENSTEFKINNVTAVSVREYTDNSVAGMRYEWDILLIRDVCENNLNSVFQPID